MCPLLVDLSALVQALGVHSLVASRAVTALSGVLAVPLTFAACNEFLRREAWPAERRRLAAAVAALAAAWQMRRAERTGRWWCWVLAGLALGLAQYVNINGAVVLAVIGLLALFDLARAPAARRRGGRAGGAAAGDLFSAPAAVAVYPRQQRQPAARPALFLSGQCAADPAVI
jgi:hypothetical protein